MRDRIDEQQSETGSQGQQEERNRRGGHPACDRQPPGKPVARVLVALLGDHDCVCHRHESFKYNGTTLYCAARLCVTHQQPQDDDDWDRNADQIKQNKAHDLPLTLFTQTRNSTKCSIPAGLAAHT
jgi:hypothetical protein